MATYPSSQEPTFDINLRELVFPLFRHKHLLMATFLGVFLSIAAFNVFYLSNYYRAEMKVVVQQDRSDPAISATQSAPASSKPVTTDQVPSEVELLSSIDIMRAVVDSCKLVAYRPPMFRFLEQDDPTTGLAKLREIAALKLVKKVKVKVSPGSDVISVSYARYGNPEIAGCVLRGVAQQYLAKHRTLDRPAGSTVLFEAEADRYKQALQSTEASLIKLTHDEGVAAPDLLRTDLAQQLSTAQDALHRTLEAIAGSYSRLEHDRQRLKEVPARSATNETQNAANLLLQNLEQDLLAGQVKRYQLLVKYEPTFPLVREVDQEIAATRDSIQRAQEGSLTNRTTDRNPLYDYLSEDAMRAEADLDTQRAAAPAIHNSIQDIQTKMVRMDALAITQAQLIREEKANEASYLLYLAKRDQERTTDAIQNKGMANVAIAVPATDPLLPAYGTNIILAAGFLLGAFLGILFSYLMEYFDSSISTPAQVVGRLGIQVLASVPKKAVS